MFWEYPYFANPLREGTKIMPIFLQGCPYFSGENRKASAPSVIFYDGSYYKWTIMIYFEMPDNNLFKVACIVRDKDSSTIWSVLSFWGGTVLPKCTCGVNACNVMYSNQTHVWVMSHEFFPSMPWGVTNRIRPSMPMLFLLYNMPGAHHDKNIQYAVFFSWHIKPELDVPINTEWQ